MNQRREAQANAECGKAKSKERNAVMNQESQRTFRSYWPRITKDQNSSEGREWIHPEIPRYYLYRFPPETKSESHAGKWAVIDRDQDLVVVGPYRHKAHCIRAFVRKHDPEGW